VGRVSTSYLTFGILLIIEREVRRKYLTNDVIDLHLEFLFCSL